MNIYRNFVAVSGYPLCMRQNYDSSAFRVSSGGYFTDLMTSDVCKQLCTDQMFPYAGLMFGEYCLCSNHTLGKVVIYV